MLFLVQFPTPYCISEFSKTMAASPKKKEMVEVVGVDGNGNKAVNKAVNRGGQMERKRRKVDDATREEVRTDFGRYYL